MELLMTTQLNLNMFLVLEAVLHGHLVIEELKLFMQPPMMVLIQIL